MSLLVAALLFGLALVPADALAQAGDIPANARTKTYGRGRGCDPGFRREKDACAPQ